MTDQLGPAEIGWTVSVLDKGYVKLVAKMGSDEFIVECARMSTGGSFVSWDSYEKCVECGANWLILPQARRQLGPGPKCGPCCDNAPAPMTRYPDGDLGMLRHMMRENHTSPYEFGELVVEVKAPLFVFREWHRHRTQSYSEASARYAPMTEDCYVPLLSRIQKQSKTNKQASGEPFDVIEAQHIVDDLEIEQTALDENYRNMLDQGVAREVARINTPVSRYSTMRAKANLLNWFRFLKLRLASNAQWEIQEYARAVEQSVRAVWPRTYALFEEFDLQSMRLSRTDVQSVLSILPAAWSHPDDLNNKLYERIRKAGQT